MPTTRLVRRRLLERQIVAALGRLTNIASVAPVLGINSLFAVTFYLMTVKTGMVNVCRMNADVIFVNGKFTTLDDAQPDAEAVAVIGGRLAAVGNRAEVEKLAGTSTTVVDLKGRRVVPGLVDAHCHPVETLWMKDDWVDGRFPGTDTVAKVLE